MDARSLSRTEAKVVLSLEAEEAVELTVAGIQDRARISRVFARKVAHDLVRKGWLQRLGRGRYLLSPSRHGPDAIADTDPLRFGSRLVTPYYFGFATAAELHGLLPQASGVYYLATPRRSGHLGSGAARFRRVHVPPRRFFGVESMVRRGETLSVSDVERTVLDCLARPDLSGGLGGAAKVIASAGRRMNWARLARYLHRIGERSLGLRLGFLVESLRPAVRPPPGWLDRLSARPGEPYVPLGRPSEFGRRGRHVPRWHVIENVSPGLLRAEVEVR